VFDPSGRAPAGFEPVAPTLEDAYLVLVRGLSEAPPPAADANGERPSAVDGAFAVTPGGALR
jgi:hypothetical protein